MKELRFFNNFNYIKFFRGEDCRRIEDSKKRLGCYDNAGRNFEDNYRDRRGPEGRFPEPCRKLELRIENHVRKL